MLSMNFTTKQLEDYYNNRFHKDLRQFFDISKENNIEVVTGFKVDLHSVFHHRAAALATNVNEKEEYRVTRDYKKEDEEEILFVALISFIFSTEKVVTRESTDYSESEIALCMNAFGFPWIESIHRMSLGGFLSLDSIKGEFFRIEEVEMLRNAMFIVEPFMLNKLIAFLKTWDNGLFYQKNKYVDVIGAYIGSKISNGLLMFYRSYYKYEGLIGLHTPSAKDYNNYKQQFHNDFRKYFSCATKKDGFLMVLGVDAKFNHRWRDGNPGGSLEDNLKFACFFIYMTIVQQSILEYAKDAEIDFHKCSGWPLIYSGPGVGPYLHPLKMLEYAGLSPLKYETPILLEFAKTLFPYLRQDINTILNGNESAMEDISAGKRFFDTVDGHKINLIKRYLDKETKEVLDLLAKWQMHPDSNWHTLLDKEGIPIQKPIK